MWYDYNCIFNRIPKRIVVFSRRVLHIHLCVFTIGRLMVQILLFNYIFKLGNAYAIYAHTCKLNYCKLDYCKLAVMLGYVV